MALQRLHYAQNGIQCPSAISPVVVFLIQEGKYQMQINDSEISRAMEVECLSLEVDVVTENPTVPPDLLDYVVE